MRYRVPLVALAFLLIAGTLHLHHYLPLMPEKIATHFDGSGRPDGWMSHRGLMIFDIVMLSVISLIMLSAGPMIRRLPPSMLNIPNRDYWLVPERRNEVSVIMMNHMIWLVCWAVAFFTAVDHMIFTANRAEGGAHVAPEDILTVVGVALALMAVWVSTLFRAFQLPKGP